LGTGHATLDNFNGSNVTYNLGALMGGANTTLTGRLTNSAVTPGTIYSIGANGLSTTFAGTISNGLDTVSIVKVGTGALLLNGNSTYTGPTTVSSGTLGGTGSITSPLTLAASATLAPGSSSSSVGTFTINSTANLQGAVDLKLNQSGPTASNDEVVVTGALTASGTLVVTSVGGTIVNGTTFQLFNQPVTGFSSVTLPSGGGSYNWNNNLSMNGSITLASGGATNTSPVSLSTSLSGKNLTISWPASHLGWLLQVQTNSLSVGINQNNWFTVGGSSGVTSVVVPIDSTAPTVFYRLVSQ
jgi:autotransporter-associated beta strand protein